jgi:choice-of-anchor C domain-containing protein
MMRRKDTSALIARVAATLVGLIAIPASASLITNGSFESGPPISGYIALPGGSTVIPGWTVTGNSIDVVDGEWVASDGRRSVDLDGTPGPGGISQAFATNPGSAYRVEFDVAGNVTDVPVIKLFRVSAAGQSQDMWFDTTGKTKTNMGWEPRSFTFTATDSQTTLAFQSLDTSYYGAVIDNVRVSPVPEPAIAALLLPAIVLRRQRPALPNVS